jgi:NTE family protein
MDVLLALGGGGSKGNAHIGVLKVLEREGFRVRAVAGTSAGGIAAATYAAGFPADVLEAHMSQVDQRSLFGFHLGDQPALMGVEGVTEVIQALLGERSFAELKIPCALTAVDLDSGREMVLKDGRVLDAVLATIAIPGIFPPKRWNERMLVDGGVLDPVPVSVVREISPVPNLPVVAVTLTSVPTERGHLPALGPKAAEAILTRITRLKVAQAFEIFLRGIEIGMSSITEMRLAIDRPDVIVRPDVGHIGYLDQVDVPDVVKLGEDAMETALPELRRAYSARARFARWWERQGTSAQP